MISRILLDAGAWCAVQVGAGYLAHRVPDSWLADDHGLLHVAPGEPAFYDRLHVRAWKSRLPEAGAVFGGLDKRRLTGASPGALAQYAGETRRAELTHWLALAPLPLFVALNLHPPILAAGMVAYAIAVNVPCIVALRYNRARIARLLERRAVYA